MVLMMAAPDEMDPGEDIIDVLYRNCRENNQRNRNHRLNQHFQHHHEENQGKQAVFMQWTPLIVATSTI